MSQALVEFHPDAIAEARTARDWYAERSSDAAAAFMTELDHAVDHITKSPRRWPSYLHGTRRYLLRRFPYSVVYREISGVLMVVAVAHARRKPGYWRAR